MVLYVDRWPWNWDGPPCEEQWCFCFISSSIFLFTIQVLGSLQEQREAIAELRSMIEYQVGLASLIFSFAFLFCSPLDNRMQNVTTPSEIPLWHRISTLLLMQKLTLFTSCQPFFHIISSFPVCVWPVQTCSRLRRVSRRAWAGRWTAWRTRSTSCARAATATTDMNRCYI